MMRNIPCMAIGLILGSIVCSHAAEPVKLTVTIRGVVTPADAQALRESLKSVKGVKVNLDDVQPGEKGPFGHYFSPPLVIELADPAQTDIGAVAKAVSETRTPQRSRVEPSLNLVFYHPRGQIGEEDVMALRNALADVNGVESQVAGGTGGLFSEGRLWVRLEAAGGASLAVILDALKKAQLDLKLEKP